MARDNGNRRSRPTYRAKGIRSTGFPEARTALLVIDPVNDFLSPGGAAYDETKGTLALHDVIGHLKQAIGGARARGIPVLFGPMAFTDADYASEELQRRSAINRFMYEKRMFLAGSWGADFHPELRPRVGDIVLLPHKSIDVFETDLPDHLEALGITHLVIAGMTANLCCESTGRHAMERGYDVTFLSDAIGSTNIPSYEAAVHINYPLVANGVMKVEEFLAALEVPPPGNVSISRGDVVYGSDHKRIGKVSRVATADGTRLAHVVVSRGLLRSLLYIPLDAVTRVAGRSVFINVPRLVVGKLPWSRRPTVRHNLRKDGPPEQAVTSLYGDRTPTILADEVHPTH